MLRHHQVSSKHALIPESNLSKHSKEHCQSAESLKVFLAMFAADLVILESVHDCCSLDGLNNAKVGR
jgi:hypothetical protein